MKKLFWQKLAMLILGGSVFFMISCEQNIGDINFAIGSIKSKVPIDKLSGNVRLDDIQLWGNGLEGDNNYYRIPAILTTKNDVILCFTDRRNSQGADVGMNNAIVYGLVKRSLDGGKTFEDEIIVGNTKADHSENSVGDLCVFEAVNGDIVVLAAAGGGWFQSALAKNGNKMPSEVVMTRSSDEGKTWSDWQEVTNQITDSLSKLNITIDGHKITKIKKGFVGSGRGLTTNDGTMYAAMFTELTWENSSKDSDKYTRTLVISSKDNGKTWDAVGITDPENEPKMSAELTNGDLLMSLRPSTAGTRKFKISTDKGNTWNPLTVTPTPNDPGCNGEAIFYGTTTTNQDILLLSNCNDKSERKNLSIRLFTLDNSGDFTTKQLAQNAAYSSLDTLSDGSIVSLSEDGPGSYKITFRRFTLDWATDDKYKNIDGKIVKQ